ncbi:MAG: DUF6089 family protein [Bacteroidota bacterium]
MYKWLYKSALLLFLLISSYSEAQHYFVINEWRYYRNEFSINGGVTNFLGELGGRDQIGTDFVFDLEFKETNKAFILTHKYFIKRPLSLRQTFSYGVVSGNDNLTQEPFRNNRNLHFFSNIFEYSFGLEYQFLEEKVGNKYGLRNVAGRKIGWRFKSIGSYIFAGAGGFYFNPKAYYAGKAYELYDMHTEGQGLEGGPKQYKRYSISFPVGLGIRYAFKKTWGLKLELSHHFTLTDYIDDASTTYYDNNAIAQAYGPYAAHFANPTNGLLTPTVDWNPTGTGMQRGDPTDRDGFMFLTLGVYFKVKNRYQPYGGYRKSNRRLSKAYF